MQACYTKGPAELTFGHPDELLFKRGEWREVPEHHREQLLLPARVEEYGFKAARSESAAEPGPVDNPIPAADPGPADPA